MNRSIFDTRTKLVVILLMAFAVAAAIVLFFPQSLRLDESQTLWQVNRFPSEIVHAIGSDVHVPLYHFLLYFWELAFGNGVTINRVFSLIFFVASIPLFVLVGDQVYRRRSVGIFGAVLFATSPFMNWYGSEIRMYSMLVFVTLLNQYFFMRWRKEGGNTLWWGYTITAVVGSYTHYFFGLVLAAQFAFVFFYRRSFPPGAMKRFLLSMLIVAIVIAPWVIYVLHLGRAVNSVPLLPAPTLIDIFNTFSQFLAGEQSVPINSFIVALWPLLLIAWFLSFQRRNKPSPDHVYLLFSLVIPIAITFFESILYQPVYLERYLIFTLPAFFLLLAAMIDSYPPRLAAALEVAFTVFALIMLASLALNPATPVKENYQTAAQYFEQYATPQDVIAVSAPFTIYPINYYYEGPVQVYTLPIWNQDAVGPVPAFSSSTLPQEVQQIAGDHARLWLLLSYNQGYQQNIQSYFDAHYQRLASYTLSPGMTLELYQLRYDVNTSTMAMMPGTTP